MDRWKTVFVEGLCPLLDDRVLECLLSALLHDDVRLIHGYSTSPPPMVEFQDQRCECACLIGFCGMASGLGTVGQIRTWFLDTFRRIERALGHGSASKLTGFWDRGKPHEVRRELTGVLAEVLAERKSLDYPYALFSTHNTESR